MYNIISKQNHNNLDISFGYGLTVDWWAVGVLFMEMIYDSIPSIEQQNTLCSISQSLNNNIDNINIESTNLWNICNHSREELQLQLKEEQLSDILFVEDILQKLLCISIECRWCIWSKEEIFQHPFFYNINWDDVRERKCPTIQIDKRLGYLELFENEEEKDNNDQISAADQALFDGF